MGSTKYDALDRLSHDSDKATTSFRHISESCLKAPFRQLQNAKRRRPMHEWVHGSVLSSFNATFLTSASLQKVAINLAVKSNVLINNHISNRYMSCVRLL